MVLGAVLLLGALSLFLYNQYEAAEAGRSAAERLVQVRTRIELRREEQAAESDTVVQPSETPEEESGDTVVSLPEAESVEMTEVEIDGYPYIGYLSFPTLGEELPVMADWDYAKLKLAACRYTGTVKGGDLVVMAHNSRHFKRLPELSAGDAVLFTDMDGGVTLYEVVGRDILAPTAVEEMTSGDFDLTLFTCTYGGKSRVTVYCDRLEQ